MIWLLVFLVSAIVICSELTDKNNRKDTIFIGLALDERSLSDAVLLIHSALQTARRPEQLHFLVLACGHDEIAAAHLRKLLQKQVHDIAPVSLRNSEGVFNHFFGGWSGISINIDIRAFSLPEGSGFALQLAASSLNSNNNNMNSLSSSKHHSSSSSNSKHKRHRPQHSHWNSPSGADMARFFLPKVFTDIVTTDTSDRILYLDNDVIVSCCLEEIFFSELKPDSVVGVVLDDLKWATATQFERHYNSSHPLVARHMRLGHKTHQDVPVSTAPLTSKEFIAAVPKYPNDGVLLFAVSRYNQAGVLQDMDLLAAANVEDFVVNLGTQQFTVLTQHDRWTELSPRANLRHFPDMARGFLMWFYYHGLLHFAGQSKPAGLCLTDKPLTPFANQQRMFSLTPYLVALHDLYLRRHSVVDLRNACDTTPRHTSTSSETETHQDTQLQGWKDFCAAHVSQLSSSSVTTHANITHATSILTAETHLQTRAIQSNNPFGSDVSQSFSEAQEEREERVTPLRHSLSLFLSSRHTETQPQPHCLSMIATAPDLPTFLSLLFLLSNGKKEENLVYLRLGSVTSQRTEKRVFPYIPAPLSQETDTNTGDASWSGSATQRHGHWLQVRDTLRHTCHLNEKSTFFPQNLGRFGSMHRLTQTSWWSGADWMRVVDDIVAMGAAGWSFTVFPLSDPHYYLQNVNSNNNITDILKNNKNIRQDNDNKVQEIVQEKIIRDYFATIGESYFAALSSNNNNDNNESNNNNKKPRFHYSKASVRRSLDIFYSNYKHNNNHNKIMSSRFNNQQTWPVLCRRDTWRDFRSSLSPSECLDVLTHLRHMQRKHWEIMCLVAQTENEGISVSTGIRHLLSHLAALDLQFMRPPLIFLSLRLKKFLKITVNDLNSNDRDKKTDDYDVDSDAAITKELEELRDWLRMQGYVLGLQHSEAAIEAEDTEDVVLYIWGVRMNHAEVATAIENLQKKT